MERILERLTKEADIVILDTPPLAAVTDAAVLGGLVDAALLVVEQRRAAVTLIEETIRSMQAVGGHVIGAVLNKAGADARANYYAYYYTGVA